MMKLIRHVTKLKLKSRIGKTHLICTDVGQEMTKNDKK